jgi:hypothetical protein
LIGLAKNVEGVPQCCLQVFGNDIRRKENVAALIQHITAIIGHWVRSCTPFQAGAHVSLGHWRLSGRPSASDEKACSKVFEEASPIKTTWLVYDSGVSFTQD